MFIPARNRAAGGWTAWESSPVDWCEENYDISLQIAEFTNTISNVVLIAIPAHCLRLQLWASYAHTVSLGPQIILAIMFLTGIASAYFHWTLSLLGQFLDEVLIIWSICMAYDFFLPNKYRPAIFIGRMSHALAIGVAILLTLCWFVSPLINYFWLMAFYVPVLCIQIIECFGAKKDHFQLLNRIGIALGVAAILFWVLDQCMCDTWTELFIPGLHNLWHLLSPVAVYFSMTAFAYRKVKTECNNVKATIKFCSCWVLGLPYVVCEECSLALLQYSNDK